MAGLDEEGEESGEEEDEFHYANNPLYTSKGELYSNELSLANNSISKATETDRSPEKVFKERLIRDAKMQRLIQPNLKEVQSAKKAIRRYSIDAMLVMNRIEK
jgi:hypothetical protein